MRSEKWRKASSLLAAYLATLALAIVVLEYLGGAPLYATVAHCPTCRAEWVGQTRLIGALECEHGPEWDPNCPAGADGTDCWELTGMNSPKNGKKCMCFTCAAGRPCEPEIHQWIAWCTEVAGNPCNTQNDVNGPNYRVKNAAIPGGGNCTFVANPAAGYISVPFCGPPTAGPPGAALGCKNNNGCVGVGLWTTFNGPRKKC